MVKCKEFYKYFKRLRFLNKSKYNEYNYQFMQINNKIYKEYIKFKKEYTGKLSKFIQNIRNMNNSIGLHYRMNDKCFKFKCRVNNKVLNKFKEEIVKLYVKNSSILFISTLNNEIARSLSNGFKYLQYMAEIYNVKRW